MTIPSLETGIAQFNAQAFYACHDTLEALWIEAASEEKAFYQGILQIAVACYHLQNHNGQGAMILLGEGMHRLRSYLPEHQGLDLAALVASSYDLLTTLQSLETTEIAHFATEFEGVNPDLEGARRFPRLHPATSPQVAPS